MKKKTNMTFVLNAHRLDVSISPASVGYFLSWWVDGRLLLTETIKRREDLVLVHIQRRVTTLKQKGETYAFDEMFRQLDALAS